MAESVAQQFGPTPGNKNAVNTVNNAVTHREGVVPRRCAGLQPSRRRRERHRRVVRVERADVVRADHRHQHADRQRKGDRLLAVPVKPLDVMIVLDRTGSMCRTGSGGYERPICPDMKNARDGIKTFLGMMDPSTDKVGLALTPPVLDASWVSSCKIARRVPPWTGTSNPNAPPGPNVNGKFYGLDAYWPSWIPSPGHHAFAVHGGLARGCGRFRGRRLPRQRPGSRLDPQSGVCDHPAPGLRRRRGKHELRARASKRRSTSSTETGAETFRT